MKNVAKGDVQQLCIYTRSLLDQLHAARETTMDLLTNLMEALKLAPNNDFQRCLNMRIDMWSTKQIDWKQDGSDLMEEAEQYYQELRTTRAWGTRGKCPITYALSATYELEDDQEPEDMEDKENAVKLTKEDLVALAAQMQKLQPPGKQENKYSWKYKPRKDGEPNTKKVFQDGEKKIYYWCTHQKMWTRHKPSECKRYPGRTEIRKKQSYKDRKKAYVQAKAALLNMKFSSDSEEDSNTDVEQSKSDQSVQTEYLNESDNDSNTS
jgi:hypothetical protein